MDLTLQSLSIKVFEFEFSLSGDSRSLRLQENGDDAFCGLHTSHLHTDGVLIFVLLGHWGRLLTMSHAY